MNGPGQGVTGNHDTHVDELETEAPTPAEHGTACGRDSPGHRSRSGRGLAAAGLALGSVVEARGLLMIGYLLQWLGHRIEGNTMGEWIVVCKLLGRPYVAVAPQYHNRDFESGTSISDDTTRPT